MASLLTWVYGEKKGGFFRLLFHAGASLPWDLMKLRDLQLGKTFTSRFLFPSP
jgi:hypothetical protein